MLRRQVHQARLEQPYRELSGLCPDGQTTAEDQYGHRAVRRERELEALLLLLAFGCLV